MPLSGIFFLGAMYYVDLWWLGASCFRLRTADGVEVIVDPYLDFRASFNPPPLRSGEVSRADIVLVTHGHFDHFMDARRILESTGAFLVASREVAEFAVEKWGLPRERAVAIGYDEEVELKGIRIYATRGRHASSLETLRWWLGRPDLQVSGREEVIRLFKEVLVYDEVIDFGFTVPAGPLQGYVLTTRQGLRVWFVSETLPIPEVADYSRRFRPNLAIVSAVVGREDSTLEIMGSLEPCHVVLSQFDKIHPTAPSYRDEEEIRQRLLSRVKREDLNIIIPRPGKRYRLSIALEELETS